MILRFLLKNIRNYDVSMRHFEIFLVKFLNVYSDCLYRNRNETLGKNGFIVLFKKERVIDKFTLFVRQNFFLDED